MANVIDFESDPGVIWEMYPTFGGELAFDVGANGGMVASILAANFSRAFEPHPDSFLTLSELGPPVEPQNVALTDHVGTLELRMTEVCAPLGEYVTGDSLPWGLTTGMATMACSTLDAEVENHGVPDFIKIDPEGHEVKIIEGGKELFASHLPRLLIEVHAEENGPLIESLLPAYEFVKIEHPGYEFDSNLRRQHFYLLSV